MRLLSRYIAAEMARVFVGTLAAVCAIYLVVDFVDRAKAYTGEGWQRDAAILYGYKAIVVGYQLAPAAMLLAAGITLAGFRRRGEYTAMRALAVSPLQVIAPIALVCSIGVVGMIAADELCVGFASRRVDEITTNRFKSFGDWRTFFGQTSWFRGQRHIYHLRDGDAETGFENVTVFTLSNDFRLSKRVDARKMLPLGDNAWMLVDGRERSLTDKDSKFTRFDQRRVVYEESSESFRILKGRPEQLRAAELDEQIRLRQNVGLPVERYVLAKHNKVAYPLAGLPAGILAAALALRRGRKGYVTEAVAEGFLVIIGLWALMVVGKAATLAGSLTPAPAAWGPVLFMAALALVGLRRSAV